MEACRDFNMVGNNKNNKQQGVGEMRKIGLVIVLAVLSYALHSEEVTGKVEVKKQLKNGMQKVYVVFQDGEKQLFEKAFIVQTKDDLRSQVSNEIVKIESALKSQGDRIKIGLILKKIPASEPSEESAKLPVDTVSDTSKK